MKVVLCPSPQLSSPALCSGSRPSTQLLGIKVQLSSHWKLTMMVKLSVYSAANEAMWKGQFQQTPSSLKDHKSFIPQQPSEMEFVQTVQDST